MATKKSKVSSHKQLKKTTLQPVKNLKTTTPVLPTDGIQGESTNPPRTSNA